MDKEKIKKIYYLFRYLIKGGKIYSHSNIYGIHDENNILILLKNKRIYDIMLQDFFNILLSINEYYFNSIKIDDNFIEVPKKYENGLKKFRKFLVKNKINKNKFIFINDLLKNCFEEKNEKI